MNEYRISLNDDKKHIYSGHIRLSGSNPEGERLSFTNYYMEKNGRPFIGICGEFHYSRYDHRFWEDEIVKMKMNGVNIISSYIFWNHHEEIRGEWDWSGNKNLREFIRLCGKHKLYVIIRIGPFNHGEVRNGGLPDWLFGMPFDIRSNDKDYLETVRVLFKEISGQIRGLLYKEGGPVIGTQIENEHNHSAAVWAHTAGINDMWFTPGTGGEGHLIRLKEMARDAGIDTPLYTCTGWGGASTPVEEMLPLWGGYAFWPWIYYENDMDPSVAHPATPEYIFRDKHNNGKPVSYNFEPLYKPEDYPYACCEMAGGMTPFYKYRFQFPYNSVPAMSIIKVAEGCNFLGYYMFHGGSNPKGKRNPFTNDKATPKISYDFNAMIGEFGQVRESYKRTKLQHYFYSSFEEQFSVTKTILPENAESMDPEDLESLRYACRSREGAGFLFINNFQDHREMADKKGLRVILEREKEQIAIPSKGTITIRKDSFSIFPYNFSLGAAVLKYSTTQLITRLSESGKEYYFFFTPFGEKGEYCFKRSGIGRIANGSGTIVDNGEELIVTADGDNPVLELEDRNGESFVIYTMSDECSLDFWKAPVAGKERVLISNGTVLAYQDRIKIESTDETEVRLAVFPGFEKVPEIDGREMDRGQDLSFFTGYRHQFAKKEFSFDIAYRSPSKALMGFNDSMFTGVKEILLRIRYKGDIGHAFIDGDLINDNFNNEGVWEIGLMRFKEDLIEKGLFIYISPNLIGSTVNSNTTMAGWSNEAEESIAEILSIDAVPVYEVIIG
jgi:hypothetical protein